tara:strand:+ start:5116 stop:7272 length:2157 start_codon:yes stop_codon:yes gene_type:complete
MSIYAYSYRRISSFQQSKRGSKDKTKDIDSLDTQAVNAQKWVDKQPKERDVLLDTTLNLEEVVSGSTGQNVADGALGVFLEGLRQGTIQSDCILLLDTWTRFSRQTLLDQVKLFTDIVEHGVTIVTIDDGAEYTEEKCRDNALAVFLPLVVKMNGAAELSNATSRSGLATWKRRLDDCLNKGLAYTGRCPFWLRVNKHKKYEVIPEKVNVIKEIFKSALDGVSNKAIAFSLNSRGIATMSGKGAWQDATLSKLLSNAALIGWHDFKERRRGTNFKPVDKKLKDGGTRAKIYPVVISETDFAAVGKLRASRDPFKGKGRRTSVSNMFGHLLSCGYYGGSMLYKGTKTTEKRKYSYYLSTDWRNGVQPSYRHGYQTNALEDAFVDLLKWFDFDLSESHKVPQREKNLNDVIQRVKNDIEQNEEVIQTFLQDYENTNLSKALRDRLLKRMDKKETEKSKLVKRLDAAQDNLNNYNTSKQPIEEMKSLMTDFNKKRYDTKFLALVNTRLRRSINKIELFGGGVKYDQDEFNKQLSELEAYIKGQDMKDERTAKAIMGEALHPPENCPALSTDNFVGLNQISYAHCFYYYEICISQLIQRHVPLANHAEAFSIIKRIPDDDPDNRFFVVYPSDNPFADIEDWSRMYPYRITVKPYEEYTRKHSPVCKGVEWAGSWDSIMVHDPDWKPKYYSKISAPIIQHFDNGDKKRPALGMVGSDGIYTRT